MKPSKQLIEACETYFVAKAYEDTIRPTVNEIKNEIINFFKFKVSPEWVEKGRPEYITDHKYSYLMNDQDSNIYFRECYEKNIEAGFGHLLGDTYELNETKCPLLIAEATTREASWLIMDLVSEDYKMNFKNCYNLKIRDQVLELTLQLCAPYIKTETTLKKFAL